MVSNVLSIATHMADWDHCRRQNPTSKYYDYKLIHERLKSIIIAREEGDILRLVNLLRSGLVRNLGNISTPRLFNRAFAGTKLLIEDYITQVAQAIADVTKLPTSPGTDGNSVVPGFSSQAKLDLLHDTRQAFGRSTLVLQGGAIFGLCHLGVVKALFARGLLPRIITGTATGALIAALVGIHTEDELPEFLSGESIDLSAFAGKTKVAVTENGHTSPLSFHCWRETLQRRVRRFFREGYFLDVTVLEECVRANVGDLTFEEAYNRTKRVLNITVATTGRGGVPNLLNYLTAPNVVSFANAQPGSELIGAVDMVSSNSIKRILPVTLRTINHIEMQRPLRGHRAMVSSFRDHVPALDARFVHRSRIAIIQDIGALQRKPLYRQPSTSISRSLPTKRHAWPLSHLHARWPHLADRRHTAPHHHGDPPPSAATRQSATTPAIHPAIPSRRTGPRRVRDSRSRGSGQRLHPPAGDTDAGQSRLLDLARREERLACCGRFEGPVRGRVGTRSGVPVR